MSLLRKQWKHKATAVSYPVQTALSPRQHGRCAVAVGGATGRLNTETVAHLRLHQRSSANGSREDKQPTPCKRSERGRERTTLLHTYDDERLRDHCPRLAGRQQIGPPSDDFQGSKVDPQLLDCTQACTAALGRHSDGLEPCATIGRHDCERRLVHLQTGHTVLSGGG